MVSVIIPNYNHAAYLQERIESVLNQTYQDFEVILLDDCSTDNSPDIIENYRSHPKVSHVLFNESNSGSVFKQWVKGINLAKGEYIWIAESDDYAEKEFLAEALLFYNAHPQVGLVYCDTNYISDCNSTKALASIGKNKYFNTDKWSHNHVAKGKVELLKYTLQRCTINNGSAVLFKKDTLKRVDFKSLVKYKNAGDLFVYTSIMGFSDIGYIAKPLNNMRHHATNTTGFNSRTGLVDVEFLEIFVRCSSQLSTTKETKHIIRYLGKDHFKRYALKLADLGREKNVFSFISKLEAAKCFTYKDKIIFRFILYYRKSNLPGFWSMLKIFDYYNWRIQY